MAMNVSTGVHAPATFCDSNDGMRIVLALLIAVLQVNVVSTLDPSGAWELDRGESEWPAEEDFPAGDGLLQPAEHLVIRLTQTTVTFYDRNGLRRLYRLSGATDQSERHGEPGDGRARWDGADLRIERRPAAGLKVVEIYDVDPQAHKLTLTIVAVRHGVSTGRRIRYVYDALLPR
jgi:hypothetical protein